MTRDYSDCPDARPEEDQSLNKHQDLNAGEAHWHKRATLAEAALAAIRNAPTTPTLKEPNT